MVQEAGCWWQPLQCPTGSVGLASAASSEEWGGPGREPAPGRRVCLGRLAGWPAGRSVSCLGSHHAQRLGPTDGEGAAFCGQQCGRLCRFRGFPSQGTACRGQAGSSHHPACWPFSWDPSTLLAPRLKARGVHPPGEKPSLDMAARVSRKQAGCGERTNGPPRLLGQVAGINRSLSGAGNSRVKSFFITGRKGHPDIDWGDGPRSASFPGPHGRAGCGLCPVTRWPGHARPGVGARMPLQARLGEWGQREVKVLGETQTQPCPLQGPWGWSLCVSDWAAG